MKSNTPYMVSVDWLQLFCHADPSRPVSVGDVLTSPRRDRAGYHRDYKVVAPSEYMKGYKFQFSLKYKGYTIAHCGMSPSDPSRNQFGAAFKVANPVLYVAQWRWIAEDAIAALGWQAQNITRLDLACDLNEFYNGMSIPKFIAVYDRVPTASRCSFIRDGSNKYCIHGVKDLWSNERETIRWGSRSSGVSVYLYNKSKELRQKKYKPWIVDSWRAAGLDVEHVWRVEISINSKGTSLRSLADEEFSTLFVDDIDTQAKLNDIFAAYAKRYFSFRRVTTSGAKTKKNMPHVALLPPIGQPTCKPTTLYAFADSGRTERLVSNYIAAMIATISEADYDEITWPEEATGYDLFERKPLTREQCLSRLTSVKRAFDDAHYIKHYRHAMEQQVKQDALAVLRKRIEMREQMLHLQKLKSMKINELRGGGKIASLVDDVLRKGGAL